MKQPKRLTLAQKEYLSRKKKNPEYYAFCKETEDTYVFWNKRSKEQEIFIK